MLLELAGVLAPHQVREFRRALEQANWTEGRETAGHAAQKVKDNLQLAQGDPVAAKLGQAILDALGADPRFIAAALPLRVLPPRFNRYEGGGNYGAHVDSAIFAIPGTPHRIRSDISATLFFSDPHEYDGGELVVEDTYGAHVVKLPAGHMVLYPSTSLHKVTPVTRGTRFASFFWIQSLVRDDQQRSLLYQLDGAIQQLGGSGVESPAVTQLIGVYHNLLRLWSET